MAVIFNGADRETFTNTVSMPERGVGAAMWPSGQGEQPAPWTGGPGAFWQHREAGVAGERERVGDSWDDGRSGTGWVGRVARSEVSDVLRLGREGPGGCRHGRDMM